MKNTTMVSVKHNCVSVHYTLTCMPSYVRFHINSLPKPCKRIETSAGAVLLMVVRSSITGPAELWIRSALARASTTRSSTVSHSQALHHRSHASYIQHTLKIAILITSASINNARSDSQHNLITAWQTSTQIHVCAWM